MSVQVMDVGAKPATVARNGSMKLYVVKYAVAKSSDRMKMPRVRGLWKSVGSSRSENGSCFESGGKTRQRKTSARKAMTASERNVMRQPSARPTTRPSGRPKIMAIEEPVAIIESANGWRTCVTRRVASGPAIDQKMEWAQATAMRAPMSIGKFTAKAEPSCPSMKRPIVRSSRRRSSMRQATSINGSESKPTIQA